MTMEEKIQKIKEIVQKELSCSGHNMEHLDRVYNLCLHLAEGDLDVNLEVLQVSALMHDIARVREDMDISRNIDHAILGAEMAGDILLDFGYSEEFIESVKHAIFTHRFRNNNEPKTKEAKILFDADKLDILGSMGIARLFMFSGQHSTKMFLETPLDEYIKDNLMGGDPSGRIKEITIHAPNLEFEIKLKSMGDRLYTSKAKELAIGRINFMEKFFNRMEKEMKGDL